jgi:hypothetical protein
MRFTTVVRLSILAAVLALPADALGANTIRTSSVTSRVVVPTGSPSTIRLDCPASAVALNGAVTRRGAGVAILGSRPGRRAGSWTFRAAASGTGSRSVSTVLRCVRFRLPAGISSVRLDVRTRNRPGIVIAPGETATARLGCGRAWTATGYALSGGGDAVRLPQALPLAHGWWYTLENTGSTPARVRVSARCIRTKVTARRAGGGTAELRFGFTRRSFEQAFPAGPSRRASTGSCGGSRFSVAAGIQLDPADPFESITASPTGGDGARWTFRHVGPGDGFRAYMVCLGRGSAFR